MATASVALAQGEPATSTRLHSEIRDAAELFSPEAIKKAETALERIERDTRVATVIETIESLDGEKIEEAALERARRSGGRGIYILIAKSETKIQVLVSKEFTGLVSEPQRVAIREAFIEDFKKRDFDAGLERAVEEIGEVLAKAKADGKFGGLAEGPGRGEGAGLRVAAGRPRSGAPEPGGGPADHRGGRGQGVGAGGQGQHRRGR